MASKNGFLNNSAGELVLWCNGTEVMTFDTSKVSFFAETPVVQADHITDSTATNGSDQKKPVNDLLVVGENIGLQADS